MFLIGDSILAVAVAVVDVLGVCVFPACSRKVHRRCCHYIVCFLFACCCLSNLVYMVPCFIVVAITAVVAVATSIVAAEIVFSC